MRRTAAIIAVTALSLTAFAAPSGAADRAWELDRRGGRETVIGLSYTGFELGEPQFLPLAIVPGSKSGPDLSRATTLRPVDVGLRSDDIWNRLSGDVDGDGDAELVIPGHLDDGTWNGGIAVVPGARGGPRVDAAYVLSSKYEGSNYGFGSSALVSDLDRDGFADLVTKDRGITIFWGSPRRLSHLRSTHMNHDPRFGALSYLRAGNVRGDRRRELVLVNEGLEGDPEDRPGGYKGEFQLCTVTASRSLACTSPADTTGGVSDVLVDDVAYGGRDELVLGVPIPHDDWEKAGPHEEGMVEVHYGDGLNKHVRVTQNTPGIPGSSNDYDGFGTSLASGPLNADGKSDLLVGAPGEDNSSRKAFALGRATIIYGSRKGLGTNGGLAISQNSKGVPDSSEPQDRFGAEVALLQVNTGGPPDILVGATGENDFVGSVTVILTNAEGRPAWWTSRVIRPRHVGIRGRTSEGEGIGFGTFIGH